MDDLAHIAPSAQVLVNRVWVQDGALLSSAAITAGIDLALHCIAQVCGDAVAANVAQVMVAAGRRSGMAPQQSPLLAWRDHLHPAVHRVQDAVADQTGTGPASTASTAIRCQQQPGRNAGGVSVRPAMAAGAAAGRGAVGYQHRHQHTQRPHHQRALTRGTSLA